MVIWDPVTEDALSNKTNGDERDRMLSADNMRLLFGDPHLITATAPTPQRSAP